MSSPIILCRVKALYTFEGTEPTALNFDKGDSIDVLAQLDSGWWDGWYVCPWQDSPIELVSAAITSIDYLGVMASEDGFQAIMLK